MDDLAVRIVGLVKSYQHGFLHRRSRVVLGPLDLDLRRGEVLGYLGPNGAGKTTTLKALLGFIRVDAGEMRVLGHAWSDARWRRRTGYLPEHPYFYDYLTALEYLDYTGRLIGLDAAARTRQARELLERVGLARSADRPLRRYSKGMLQRVGMAQALLGQPDLLILDEPMSGLDPLGRRLVRDVIAEQRDRGCAVLFSTHILSDAEALCDRVALLRDGKLVGCGPLADILRVDIRHLEVLVGGVPESMLGGDPARRSRAGERWRIEVDEKDLPSLVADVTRHGGRVLSVQPVRQSLEDLYVSEMTAGHRFDWVEE